MVGKRKANAMMARIEKMAKSNEEHEEEKNEYFAGVRKQFEEEKRTENKEQYLKRVLQNSSNLDRVSEYLQFKKQADRLLPSVRDELVTLVRRELDIDRAIENLKLDTKISVEDGTPILDALGAKFCTSFANILAPPTLKCLLCYKGLTHQKHNKSAVVALFTMDGPVVASKYDYRCRQCTGAPLLFSLPPSGVADGVPEGVADGFADGVADGAADVHYGPGSFGNPEVIEQILYDFAYPHPQLILFLSKSCFRRGIGFMRQTLECQWCLPVRKCSFPHNW